AVDAPFLNGPGKLWEVGIGGHSQLCDHFLHHFRSGDYRVFLGRIRIDDGDAIVAVSGADVGVVVVFRHQQIGRSAVIAGDQRGIDDRGGIVPTEAAGNFRLRQITIEMQQPAAVVVTGKGILKNAEVNVAIRSYSGSGATVGIDEGVLAGRGIE